MDPVILAAHLDPFHGCKILDLGCGCGIIPLILAFRCREIQIIGIEIQSQLAELAVKNAEENQMSGRIRILNQDIRTTDVSDIQGPADIIVSNPPYIKKKAGRINPDRQKAVARHEILLDLDQVFSSAFRLLTPRGQLVLIFPAQREADLVQAMKPLDFQLEWVRFIHTQTNGPAKRIVISVRKNFKGPCLVRPPLYIYDGDRSPTNEYATMFKP